MTTQITILPVELLHRRADARPLNDAVLAGLSESIETIGLVNPIRVRKSGTGYEVIAGSHRFAACDLASMREIPCIIVKDDDLHAELAMIDENLCRAELSPVDRTKQTARRKAIYEELHPETKRESTLKRGDELPSRQVGETGPVDRFTAETAAATGRSERAVQRDAERGEKVIDEAANLIRGTKLDTGAYLDKIKRLLPNEQVHAVKRDLAYERQKDKEPRHGGIAGRYAATASNGQSEGGSKMFEAFIAMTDSIVTVPIDDLIRSAGRQRAVLGQRASGLADRMSAIMEALDK
ncbi:ParB/RepB/Spo0J family partition protein [Mesorhizobium sp. A556]